MRKPHLTRKEVEEIMRSMEDLDEELHLLAVASNVLKKRRREQQRFFLDPLVLLERLINKGLLGLERAVARLVRSVVR